MSEQVRACVDYFRSNPGYHRILAALRQKYQRYGRAAGTICLPDASEEECGAARSFFGRFFSPPLRFQAAQFEEELQTGAFRGVSLKEVLEAYFGTELHTRKETKETLDGVLSAMLRQTAEAVRGSSSAQWLRALGEKRGGAYILLRRETAKDPISASASLSRTCRASDCLEAKAHEKIRLAVLSAEATSDPHALDQGTLSGKLFLHLLAFRSGAEFLGSAEQRERLYYENGILCDSISSLVTQVGLVLHTETGEHPAYRLLREKNELCTLSGQLVRPYLCPQPLRAGLYRGKRDGFCPALRQGRAVCLPSHLHLRPALGGGAAPAGSAGGRRDQAVLLRRF